MKSLKNYKSKKSKKTKKSKRTRKNKKQRKNKKLSGGNNIEFKFIDLNNYTDNYTDEEKESQLEEIDVLLNNTKSTDHDSSFFKKNASRIMTESHVLYMLYEGEIIGIIVGKKTDDNYISITEVEIRKKYLNKEYRDIGISGRKLLTEYIKYVTLKYPNISGFKLYNAGGKQSCFLYHKVFTELGYKLYTSEVKCNLNPDTEMVIIKNSISNV